MTRTAAKASRQTDAAKPVSGYEQDFFAWTQEQARLLREGRFSEVDRENIAEELHDLGASQKREIRSRLVVILLHLLKWRFQPSRRSGSWKSTLIGQRHDVLAELEDSPSLRTYPADQLGRLYATARLKASAETRLPLEDFPAECPFTIEEILDPDFLPGERAA